MNKTRKGILYAASIVTIVSCVFAIIGSIILLVIAPIIDEQTVLDLYKSDPTTEIVEDVLDIVNQIKSIDSNYKVFRNHKLHRFEVAKVYGLNLKTEVVWQNPLDYRLVKKVYMTRKENIEKLLKQIELDNEKLEKKEKEDLFENIMQDIKL